jgi:hypothetical protein
LFWAFFFGYAFMAAGVSIATKWMGQWGATLIGTMFLLWFFVLPIARVFGLAGIAGAPHNPNEWSSAFIALAMCGDPGFALGRCLHRGRKPLDRFKITAGGGWDLFPTEC